MNVPNKSKSRAAWTSCLAYWLSVAALVVASMIAVAYLARVLGWLTGASLTPVVAIVIPLVFGLLATVGVGVGLPRPFGRIASIWQTVFVAFLVAVFCRVYFSSVTLGSFERSARYRSMASLLGEAWSSTDDETLASLYRLRVKARRANLAPADFEPIIRDVIRPILEDEEPNKIERIEQVLATIESALPPQQP
jgi:hypothetical protein